jgi:hypothetical protein
MTAKSTPDGANPAISLIVFSIGLVRHPRFGWGYLMPDGVAGVRQPTGITADAHKKTCLVLNQTGKVENANL